MRSRLMLVALVGAWALGAAGCISKGEYAAGVKSRRAYYDATKGDLLQLYGAMPEPSRTTRSRLVTDQEKEIAAEEARAGVAAVSS